MRYEQIYVLIFCMYNLHLFSDFEYIIRYIASYHNWCLYSSITFNKAFIRWWLWVQTSFRGRSIITTRPERPSSIPRHHKTLLDCRPYVIVIPTMLQLEPYLESFFNVYPLVWWGKSKISQEYGGWVGNETLASDLDRKYVGYSAISDTLFSQILIFFQPTLMCPVEIFFKRNK